MDNDLAIRIALRIAGLVIFIGVLRWLFTILPPTLGHREMRYSGRLKFMALLGLAMAVGLAYSAGSAKPDEIILAYSMAAITFVASACLLLETCSRQVRYDETYLYDKSVWRREERKIPWTAIENFTYSKSSKMFAFHTNDGRTIRLSELLSGQDEFLDFMERKFVETGLIDS